MEESVTYQEIVEEGLLKGELREARKNLLLVGRRRFGDPPKAAVTTVEAMDDLGKLEQLIDRAFDVASWGELLGLPKRTRRKSSS